MNLPSSQARKRAAFATSNGSVSLPSGTAETNLATFSSVYGTPTNDSNKPVPDSNGANAFTLIWSCPYSAAKPFVAYKDINCAP